MVLAVLPSVVVGDIHKKKTPGKGREPCERGGEEAYCRGKERVADDPGSFYFFSVFLLVFLCILESNSCSVHAFSCISLVLVLESVFLVFKGFSLSFDLVLIEF